MTPTQTDTTAAGSATASAAAPATMTLAGINSMPAPTWNFLRINDLSLEVEADAVSPSYAPAEKILGGCGPEAATWLSRAAGRRPCFVVPNGEHREEPIEITVRAEQREVSDTRVSLCHHSEATVAIVARSDENGSGTCGTRVRLDVAEGATAHVHVYVALHEGYQYINDLGLDLADNAHVDIRYYLLGAGVTACGLRCENRGYHSSLDVDARCLARGHETVDMNVYMRLAGKKSTADFNFYGVLFDHAKKTLRDTIDLIRGARGAAGNENETVLLAGPNVVNKSIPTVLCDEDDVTGNHGATIGSISKEQLDYMRTRGLDEQSAKDLLARSVLDAAIGLAPTACAREAALTAAMRILGATHVEDLDVFEKQGEQ